jgi:hypothetical protein
VVRWGFTSDAASLVDAWVRMVSLSWIEQPFCHRFTAAP